jgi:nucleolar GTP-binding protein
MKNPFKRIVIVDKEKLINFAFSQASLRVEKSVFSGNRVEKAKKKEIMRIKTVGKIVSRELFSVVKSFPDLEKIPEIYKNLLNVFVSASTLKDALARISWASKKILELQKLYVKKLKGVRTSNDARNLRKEFYGRVSSILKKLKKELSLISELKDLKKLPDFEEVPTAIICGLPNVGKSSLLWKLTGSKPKIREYPFTTKGLMLGYIENKKRIQLIDTPGLLDRPIEKRNKIEKQALVALKHFAHLIIYVFDPSETSASLKSQENLFHEIKEFFKKPIIVVANKIDIAIEKNMKKLEKYKPLWVSCVKEQGIEELSKMLKECLLRGKNR